MKGRNGKVEFYRFLFCVFVLLFHCGKYFYGSMSFTHGVHPSFFGHAAVGVEFFFILSGFLMQKSVMKKSPEEQMTSGEYLQFMRHKYMGVFPMHAIAFVITVVCYLLKKGLNAEKTIVYLLGALPNLFLVEMTGLRINEPNHIEWYISCMLLAMAILYPLCRKYRDRFSRMIAPLLALFLYGYMIYTSGSVTGVTAWVGICYKSFLRAVAGIALGTTAYDVAVFLSTKKFSVKERVWLSVAEWSLLALGVVFSILTLPMTYEAFMPVCFVLLLALTFSGCTYGTKAFNNKFFYHLGSISLPIYLGQMAAIYLVKALFADFSKTQQVWLAVGFTVVSAYTIYFVHRLIHVAYTKMKEQKG